MQEILTLIETYANSQGSEKEQHLQLIKDKLQILEDEAKNQNSTRDFLIDHLKCWKDSGIPAPVNELQSIGAWLRKSGEGIKPMQEAMRKRMILLMNETNNLHNKGLEAEIDAGIYDNRPDLLEQAIKDNQGN